MTLWVTEADSSFCSQLLSPIGPSTPALGAFEPAIRCSSLPPCVSLAVHRARAFSVSVFGSQCLSVPPQWVYLCCFGLL